MRRILGSLLLAGFLMSLGAPLAPAAKECPRSEAASGAPALTMAMQDGCQHADAGVCLTALGCATVAPAIRPAGALLVTPTRLIVLGAVPAPRVGDLYRTGPPTPPPNQI